MDDTQIVGAIRSYLQDYRPAAQVKNIGRVTAVKDGVILLDGLGSVGLSERIHSSARQIDAMILNLGEDSVGAIVLGDFTQIRAGDEFESTGEIMSIRASNALLGRTVDALGQPIDGKGEISATTKDAETTWPVERIAPGVMDRQPVGVPLKTGLLSIDSMVPIGRGQRELIIGDRNTGKTAVAIDAIINQTRIDSGVICVYVPIGQKKSRVAETITKLESTGAMERTIVVNASAADSVARQYLAPYSATAIAESFMAQGKDVLIVYDDLTKHAWAYRQIALVLRRPPGREAYPGDIFYLHSRLLERACRLNGEHGGGSITALPIVETQFGDVSAYIPTNIISITDGQIYLETDRFNAGHRPAVDAGNSVSRVGGAAQSPMMKKVSGKLRLALAQFAELEAFTQFGSDDLDVATKKRIDRGKRLRELLVQPQFDPLPEVIQVGLLLAAERGDLDAVPFPELRARKRQLIQYLRSHSFKPDAGREDVEAALIQFMSDFPPVEATA